MVSILNQWRAVKAWIGDSNGTDFRRTGEAVRQFGELSYRTRQSWRRVTTRRVCCRMSASCRHADVLVKVLDNLNRLPLWRLPPDLNWGAIGSALVSERAERCLAGYEKRGFSRVVVGYLTG